MLTTSNWPLQKSGGLIGVFPCLKKRSSLLRASLSSSPSPSGTDAAPHSVASVLHPSPLSPSVSHDPGSPPRAHQLPLSSTLLGALAETRGKEGWRRQADGLINNSASPWDSRAKRPKVSSSPTPKHSPAAHFKQKQQKKNNPQV